MLVFIIASVVAVAVSGLCSVLEAMLLSLDDIHLETRRQAGHRYAQVWQLLRKRIDRPIAAILILNTIAHTGGATIAGGAFDEVYGAEWLWVFSVVFTIVVLLGTEIIPKVIGVNYAQQLAPVMAPVLSLMTKVLTPIIALTEWISRPFKRAEHEGGSLSIADIRTMAGLARNKSLIGKEEEKIIINATKLRQVVISSVMVTPENFVMFDSRLSNIENFETAASSMHTRYPVSDDGTADGIIGYVNFKEVVAMMPSRKEAQIVPFIRPLHRLRASSSVNEALRSLLGRRQHMALVDNEEGKVVGLVTLEDVLEEIVGDLTDEFDQLPTEAIEVARQRWKVGGGIMMDRLAKEVGFKLPRDAKDKPVSEWLESRLGHELRSGDSLKEQGRRFTVLQIRRRKAHRVLLTKE